MLKQLNALLQKLLADAKTLRAEMASKSADGTKEYEGIADDRAKLVKMATNAEELKKQIEATKALEGLDAYASDPAQPGEVRVEGSEPAGETIIERNKKGELSAVYEEGPGGLDRKTMAAISSNAYKLAFRSYVRNGQGIHGLGSSDLKALQEGVDSQGGFLVPDDMLNRMIQKEPTPTAIAALVTQLQTGRDAITMPKVNYTTDDKYTTPIRVRKTGEVPSSSTVHRVTEPTFGQVRIPVHTYMLSMPITNDMIEDSAFPILTWSSDKFRETVDLLYDDEILNGNGIGGPDGILNNAGASDPNRPAVVVSGNASNVTADGLIDLHYSVPPQYRASLRYVMSYLNAAKNLAKLKDSQNRYLFQMGGSNDGGLQGERPDTLLGRPISYSEFMPAIAANAYSLIFGDLKGFYLVRRIGFAIQVLRERYAEDNQQVLLGRLRFGGQVVEPWKMKIQKIST